MSSLPPSSPPSLSSEFRPTPRDDTDPFGFFALERKLKEQRAQHRQPLIAIGLPTSASPPPQSPHTIVSPPSTPSPPSKKPNPIHNTKRSVAHDDSDPAVEAGASTSLRRSQRQKGSKASKSTFSLTQTSRQTALTSKKCNDKENSEKSGRSRTTKKTLTARRTRPQKTRLQVAKNESDNVDEDQREKWARERRERLEYFKRLEEYQVAKENIYIV